MTKTPKKLLKWSRLDNAAKIFPATSHGANTGVFRLSSELQQAVDPALLQQALDEILPYYPHMCTVMRHGIFWYYLEQTDKRPLVEPERFPLCAALYRNSQSLLFRVSYWRHKISLDVFHVLADGSGAIAFFEALITRYLLLCHPDCGMQEVPQVLVSERSSDGFQKYYKAMKGAPKDDRKAIYRAYHLRGSKRLDGGLTILEGVADVRQVLDVAHRYHTTLTVYLTAVLFSVIHEQMYVRDQKRPVVLTIPVDLRSYFPSKTNRNFFGTIRIVYDFHTSSGTFEDILQTTAQSFRTELTPERLARRMNQLAALEHNLLLRPIPLFLKNLVLRFSGDISHYGETSALSNIGKFHLPEPLQPYVKGFGVFMSTPATQLCTCTFGNSLHLGFTSALENTEIQQRFFAHLAQEGIDIEIHSNEYHKEDALCNDVPIAK